MQTEWQGGGWTAEFYAPYLVLTNPDGESGIVQVKDSGTGRNITRKAFAADAEKYGAEKACKVYWKLRANQ